MITWAWNGPSLGQLLVLAVESAGAATACVPSSVQSSSDNSPSDKTEQSKDGSDSSEVMWQR